MIPDLIAIATASVTFLTPKILSVCTRYPFTDSKVRGG